MNHEIENLAYRFQLSVQVYRDRQSSGIAAGQQAERVLKSCLETQSTARIVFAAAPSQNEMLSYLAVCDGIDWSRVEAFHMDEYIGLPSDSPQSFGSYLRTNFFDKVPVGNVTFLNGNADPQEECARYGDLLRRAPIDLVLMGIGENGHIAFNDPPVADFSDPHTVKAVELDEACRIQQVNDGCFESFGNVPTHALTLTIPTLMSAGVLVCTVPGPAKAPAVGRMMGGPIETSCPATILRKHPQCYCYFDLDSAAEL